MTGQVPVRGDEVSGNHVKHYLVNRCIGPHDDEWVEWPCEQAESDNEPA